MKSINYQKAGINFKFIYQRGTAIIVEAKGLFEAGDAEYNEKDKAVMKLNAGYKDGVVKFIMGDDYLLVDKKKINGIKIDDESVRTVIEGWIAADKEALEKNIKEREADRPAPTLDTEKYTVYSIGCDTGLIYPEKIRPIIALAIKSNVKPIPVYRGERDKTNKFPHQTDALIPDDYVTKIDGKATAAGYEHVYVDLWCISVEDFNAAKAVIDAEIIQKKEAKEKIIKEAFAKAKATGEPVLLSKITVPEEESPLKDDGEGDMVDICEFAMPDGTISEKCFHNY